MLLKIFEWVVEKDRSSSNESLWWVRGSPQKLYTSIRAPGRPVPNASLGIPTTRGAKNKHTDRSRRRQIESPDPWENKTASPEESLLINKRTSVYTPRFLKNLHVCASAPSFFRRPFLRLKFSLSRPDSGPIHGSFLALMLAQSRRCEKKWRVITPVGYVSWRYKFVCNVICNVHVQWMY